MGLTLGIGWAVWTWRAWARGTTPGKGLLGLTVFATDTQRPATRSRMACRALGHQGLVALMAIATFGLAWVYAVAAASGPNRRTIYDEWARTVVLVRVDTAV